MALKGIQTSRVSPDYLHSNSTSHTWVFSAIAELIDNAYDPDVNASELWIDKKEVNGQVCLTFTDNGNGMVPDKLHKMLSFGYCEKVAVGNHQPIGHYGNGFKSGSMRLGKDAIVFSRRADVMSVGLLSQTYLKHIKAETVLVPIISWALPDNDRKMDSETKNNLSAICTYSIFKTEKDLINELESMEKLRTGTKIIIYNLTKNNNSSSFELDFLSDPHDIRNPESHLIDYSTIHRAVHDKAPEYKVSLREYCSILYLKPRMKIVLRGKKVKTKMISKSLSQTETDIYRPTWSTKPIPIKYGFTSSKHPEDYGVMMYHKNRLIRAYEKVGYQKQANELGVGIVGVVEAFFLTPTHNKQDFSRDEKYNGFMSNVGLKLNDYWNEKRGVTNSATQNVQQAYSPDWLWAQCDNCLKWRRLPAGFHERDLPDKWYCHMNADGAFNRCEVPEEPEDEDEALQGPSYKKTFKKQQTEQKMKIKLHEQSKIKPFTKSQESIINNITQKQQAKAKEIQLNMKEKYLQRKELEISQQSKRVEANAANNMGVAGMLSMTRKLKKLEERAAKQQQMIEELHKERSKQEAANRQMLDAAENLNITNLKSNELLEKVARHTSSAKSSSRSATKRKKSEIDEICIKTEDGSVVAVIPNPDKDSDSEPNCVDLTIDSDEEENSLSPAKKAKDSSNKSVTPLTPSDIKPDVEKLKATIDKMKTFKDQSVQTKKTNDQKTIEEYRRRLFSLQKNVFDLLSRIDSDKDWGSPENIEDIITTMIKHIEPENGE